MKLTFVFPRFKTFGGAEHLMLEFSAQAAAQGHDVVIVTRAFNEACRPYLDDRVELRVLKWAGFATRIHLVDSFLDELLSPLLLRLLPGDLDLICFVSPPVAPAMWFYKRLLRGKVKVVYYCLQPPRFLYDLMSETIAAHRPLGYLIPLVAPVYRRVDRMMGAACDSMFTLSTDYVEWCRRLYGPPEIRLLPPGIDVSLAKDAKPEEVRKRHGFGPQEKLVTTVNQLTARKNLPTFLRAMRLVVDRHPEARGVVVGEGPLRDALQNLRDQLGLKETVIFTGFLREFREVVDHYTACDVYVFLEHNVPFGLTTLEAGACGRAVVAVRGGGTLDTVIDGETGFLVNDTLDEEEIAERICWLLDHEPERRAMGERGIEQARKFSLETCGRNFVDALAEVAEATG